MKQHSKKDCNYYYKFFNLALIPLILFCFYKNGILLKKETSNIYIILMPIIFYSINLIIGNILDLIYHKRIFNKFSLYYTLLFMIISINTPIWLYLIIDLLLYFLIRYDKHIFNKIALVKLIDVLGLLLINKLSFANILESSGNYAFDFMDSLFKYQVGGIATCNFILVCILIIVMLFNIYYKKNIALISLLSYIAMLLGLIVIKDNSAYLMLLCNSTIIFELVTISNINHYSPYTYKGEIIYAVLLGIGTALLSLTNLLYFGATIMIVILSPSRLLLDKLFALDIK